MNTTRAVLLICVLVCGLPGCKKTSAARGQVGSETAPGTNLTTTVNSEGFPNLPAPDNPASNTNKILQTLQEAATKPVVERSAPYAVSRATNGTCGKKGNFAEAPKLGPMCYRTCKTKADCPPEATCDAAPTKNGKKLCFGHWGAQKDTSADAGGW